MVSKTAKKIDEAAEGLSKIPVINKLEIDKMLLFIKLFIIAPVVSLTLGTSVGLGYQFYQTKDYAFLILLIVSFVFFVFALVINARTVIKLEELRTEKAIRDDNHKVLTDIIYSEENQKNQWFAGHRSLILSRHARSNELFDKIMKFNFNSEADKMDMLDMINEEFDSLYDNYKKLFVNITNPLEEFAISYFEMPPKPNKTTIDRIEEITRRLKSLDN